MIMAGREIILGLEDSPASLAALRWTARYAHATGTVLRAVHVLDWPIGLTASATEPGTRLQVPEERSPLRTAGGSTGCSTKSRVTLGGLLSSLRDLYPRFLFA